VVLGFARKTLPANDVGPSGEPRDEIKLLARAARAGDVRAARTLLNGLGPTMLRVIRKVVGESRTDAHDVLQDAMFGLMKGLAGFREECSVTHFACRIAVMTALAARRQLRRRGGDETPVSFSDLGDLRSNAPDPAAEAEAAARRAVLWRLLDELPQVQAEALALRCIEGFSIDEIAAASGCPIETVKSRLRLAKATLRSRIAADGSARDLFAREP
jgi:RNA polymerase sigma-70 factor (ECF subfamily)